MDKTVFANEVVFQMQNYLDYEGSERLKNVIFNQLADVTLTDKIQLPSIDIYTNESMIKKFILSKIASGKEKSTINQYVRALRNFFDFIGKEWNAVTGEDVSNYLAYRTVKDKISSNYKDTLQTYINSFYSWAYSRNYIDVDIMKSVERVKRTRRKIDRLTDDEVAIVKGIRKNSVYNCLFFVMIECGLRVSEIRDLKIENIDWKAKEIEIWAEKTNEFRKVILTSDLEYAIKEYIGKRDSGYLFTSRAGKPFSKETIERMAREMGEDADCHCVSTVHIYRKTFASILYRKTHDVLLVSRLLGHKDTAVTIRSYLKDDIDDIKYRRLMVS